MVTYNTSDRNAAAKARELAARRRPRSDSPPSPVRAYSQGKEVPLTNEMIMLMQQLDESSGPESQSQFKTNWFIPTLSQSAAGVSGADSARRDRNRPGAADPSSKWDQSQYERDWSPGLPLEGLSNIGGGVSDAFGALSRIPLRGDNGEVPRTLDVRALTSEFISDDDQPPSDPFPYIRELANSIENDIGAETVEAEKAEKAETVEYFEAQVDQERQAKNERNREALLQLQEDEAYDEELRIAGGGLPADRIGPITEIEAATQGAVARYLEARDRMEVVDSNIASLQATVSEFAESYNVIKGDAGRERLFIAGHDARMDMLTDLIAEKEAADEVGIAGEEWANNFLESSGLLGDGFQSVTQLSDAQVEEAIAYAVAVKEGREPDPRESEDLPTYSGGYGNIVERGIALHEGTGNDGVEGSMITRDESGWDADFAKFNDATDFTNHFVPKLDAVPFFITNMLEGVQESELFSDAVNRIKKIEDWEERDIATTRLKLDMHDEIEADIGLQGEELFSSRDSGDYWINVIESIYSSLTASPGLANPDAPLEEISRRRALIAQNYAPDEPEGSAEVVEEESS